MSRHQTTVILILLAVLPIALLTWLGTYLIRDASRSTNTAMQAVLEDRLAVADHQLTRDLHQLTEYLDTVGGAPGDSALWVARALGDQSWVNETWATSSYGLLFPVFDRFTHIPSADAMAAQRIPALLSALDQLAHGWTELSMTRSHAFTALGSEPLNEKDSGRGVIWLTFIKVAGLRFPPDTPGMSDRPFASGWHVTDGDLIYWRRCADGALACARLDTAKLTKALFSRLPGPNLKSYPGRLSLTTHTGIPLHDWGRALPGSQDQPVSRRACGPPFTQWVLSYSPAPGEFPEPYLFPILLGVGSGSVLVLALAWIYFRESTRELRVAQQRVSFVNQISHELKTPLTNIQLYTEMAQHRIENSGDSVAKRHLGVVQTETGRLNRLIQNVLNYARHQRDRLSVQPREIALDEIVERAVENWRPLLEGKGFSVQTHLRGPSRINADPDAIEQILGNLLSNVDKYAAYGQWVAVRTEAANGSAKVIVEDRGPGIPAGKRRTIFEPFERLRSDLNEGVSGTGIGLTISRELATLHGGSLDVCAAYREGARFTLTLPTKPT